jgi:hypothetical protein
MARRQATEAEVLAYARWNLSKMPPPKPEPVDVGNAEMAVMVLDALKELAREDPDAYNDAAMWHSCTICGAGVPVQLDDHHTGCAWRRARELLVALGYSEFGDYL